VAIARALPDFVLPPEGRGRNSADCVELVSSEV
jgi:hypothetical protein